MCLYFELLFKCATTASLHFFACAEIIFVMKWLRANQWAQQCRVTFLPLQQFRQKINITSSRWLTESELSCERRTLSDQDILLETDNISNVEIKYRGFRICKVVHSEQQKTKLSTEKTRMADISGIPSHVPQEYKDQLQSFQSQIKILLQNHQVSFSHNQINRRS